MNEDIDFLINSASEGMEKAIAHLNHEFLTLRAGKASPAMLKGVFVDYYGVSTPLDQVSNINTPDGRTITVQPWEKNIIKDIEKAIIDANIGLNPTDKGGLLIINIPPLTEERRKELVKQAKSMLEDAKIVIRNIRQDANKEIKNLEISDDEKSNAESDIQTLTNKLIAKSDALFSDKEKEILTI